MTLPRLSAARAPLTESITVVNELGQPETISIPAERSLTVYVDKRELVTLMTLGAQPEWLVLGYLINQRLIASVTEVESITVDWDVFAAAVKTHAGIDRIEERTARKVVTTGCGQGSVYGALLDDIASVKLPAPEVARITQTELYSLVNTIRLQETTYKSAGSVHACALFELRQGAAPAMLIFIEDVGRHNAIDTIAGWMAIQPGRPSGVVVSGANKIFYTTGRLTSEMIIKSAQMGVPIVVSRSGITHMGYQIAQQLSLCAIGRAMNKRFACFSAAQRLIFDQVESKCDKDSSR
ncbi:MAG: formate dehydrogenase accessory sulfurtransferase FdhD [Hylemonella sp.]|nr:formate dehydrogenase accessory sulfurtransferase FdhD [Hylemonella sp.]